MNVHQSFSLSYLLQVAVSPLQLICGIGRLVVGDALAVGVEVAVGVVVEVLTGVVLSVSAGNAVDATAVAFFSSERRSLIVCCWAKIFISSSTERPPKNHFTRPKSTRERRNIR